VIGESNIYGNEESIRDEGIADLEGRTVAKVIVFYIPANFSRSVKWLSPQQRGRVIEFRVPAQKSA
jgi:hypothetical protein